MPLLGHVWDIQLVKVSDSTVHYEFNIVDDPRGQDGAKLLRTGSQPLEPDKPGVFDTIRFDTFHVGSGQYLTREYGMFEWADGMIADDAGVIRVLTDNDGSVYTARPALTNAAFNAYERTEFILPTTGALITVLPTGIYSQDSLVAAAATNAHFTGSYAIFGGRIFFGQAFTANGVSTNVAFRDVNGSYNTAGNFKASFLSSVTEKMWVVRQDSASQFTFQWTDQAASNAPTFTAPYTSTANAGRVKDSAIIGAHLCVLVQPDLRQTCSVLSIDTDGLFTPILENITTAARFSPFLGGQLVWLTGGPKAVWLPDVGSYRILDFTDAVSPRHNVFVPRQFSTSPLLPGLGAVSLENDLYFSTYGSWTKRNGTVVTGAGIFKATLDDDGVHAYCIATPERFTWLAGSVVSGLALDTTSSSGGPRRVWCNVATINGANADYVSKYLAIPEHNGTIISIDVGTQFLRTSRSGGRRITPYASVNTWPTKMPTKIRGFARGGSPPFSGASASQGTLNLKLYLDNSDTAADTQSVSNPAGPFAVGVAPGLFGRDFALDIEWVVAASSTVKQNLTVECPVEIDFMYLPEQLDVIRVGVGAGLRRVTRMGTLSAQDRAQVIANIQTLVQSQTTWTLNWWDNTASWTVVPINYTEEELEPQHLPGGGQAIAWLTCIRVA